MTTYLDAANRHLMALQEGEDVAKDSLVLHAAHLMATCAIIIDAEACGTLVDDRVLGRPDVFAKVQAAIMERWRRSHLPERSFFNIHVSVRAHCHIIVRDGCPVAAHDIEYSISAILRYDADSAFAPQSLGRKSHSRRLGHVLVCPRHADPRIILTGRRGVGNRRGRRVHLRDGNASCIRRAMMGNDQRRKTEYRAQSETEVDIFVHVHATINVE